MDLTNIVPENFIEEAILADLKSGKSKEVITRCPPEPSGYWHIGHCKAWMIDFETAIKFGGYTNLRMDDTNPTKEDGDFADSYVADLKWLGYTPKRVIYASEEYFENNERFLIKYSLYEESGELQHEFNDLYRLLDGSISTDVDLNEEYQFEILASSLDELKDSYEFAAKKIRDSYYEKIVTTSNITIEAKENNTIVLTQELTLDSSYTDEKSINTFIIIEGKLRSACSIFENINYLNDEDPTETNSYNKTYEVNYDYKFNDELFNSLEVSEDAVAMDLFLFDLEDIIIDFGEFEISKNFSKYFYDEEKTDYYNVYLDTYEEIVDNYEELDVDETFYYDEEKTKPIDFNKITKEEFLGLEKIYGNASLKDGYALLYTNMENKKNFSELFKIAINNLNNVELPDIDYVHIFNLNETNEIVLGDYIYVDEFYLDDKLVSYEDTLLLENQKIYKAFYYDEYNDDNMGLNSFQLIY